MTTKQIKDKVQTLISNAKSEAALDELIQWTHDNGLEQAKSEAVLLKGTLSELKSEKRMGLLSSTDASIRQNNLSKNILDLARSLQLLTTTNSTTDQKMSSPKPLSVFISYSKKDIELKDELITHMASLRRRKIVSNWDDRHIIGGELWDDVIKSKLREADIILFLVSASFIGTDYIWNHEIPIAEEQRQLGKARVIPIILKPCQWTKLDFAKQQALPSKGQPVTSFPDRDAAWLEVVTAIERVIEDVRQRG